MFRDWEKFKDMLCEREGLCPLCFSDNVNKFVSRIIEYDKDWDRVDDHDDFSGYTGYKCQDCDWECF